MSNFRTALLSTAAAGLMAVAVAPASAGEVEKSLTVNGRVNFAVIAADNGQNTTVTVTDNAQVSGSRFGISANAKSEAMTIGAFIELGVTASNGTEANASTEAANVRYARISVANDMGTLKIGQGSVATDGLLYRDLSSTNNAGGWQSAPFASENFRVKGDTGTATATPTTGTTSTNFAAGGRDNMVSYQTPTMSGFSVKGSYGVASHGSAAIFYDGDFDGTTVAVSLGASSGGAASGAVDSSWGTSIAVSLPGGLNAAAGYSEEDQDVVGTNDGDAWGAQIGYKMGASAASIYYRQTDDALANGDEATAYGLLLEHQLADYGTSVYGGIGTAEYEEAAGGTLYDDITSGWVGVRVNF